MACVTVSLYDRMDRMKSGSTIVHTVINDMIMTNVYRNQGQHTSTVIVAS